jgi:hypothetical protein
MRMATIGRGGVIAHDTPAPSMTDSVDQFLKEFERAVRERARHVETKSLIAAVNRQSSRLADMLDELKSTGFDLRSVTPDDLRSLVEEASNIGDSDDWRSLIRDARALLQVLDNGIVAGDAGRLRAALELAEDLERTASKEPGGRIHLPRPVRVACATCDDVVAGSGPTGAANWNGIMKRLRDHERDRHGEYSGETRESLGRAREKLTIPGEEAIEAGRYSFVRL